jgi:polyhydroxybutyrate depolymerase
MHNPSSTRGTHWAYLGAIALCLSCSNSSGGGGSGGSTASSQASGVVGGSSDSHGAGGVSATSAAGSSAAETSGQGGGGSSSSGGNAGGGASGRGGGSASAGGSSAGGKGGAITSVVTTGTGGASRGGTTTLGGARGGTTTIGGGATGGQDSSAGQTGSIDRGDAGTSSGCGKAGALTGVKTGQTITIAGKARTYVLSVPTNYTGTTPLALVLVWHGANLSGSLARTLFNLESKSNGAAVFVYPDGLVMSSGSMTGWDLAAGSDDFKLFEDLVSTMKSNYCIDSNRIFSTGHSMGAMMTNTLGCTYGDVLRAIAPASGTPPGGGRATCTGKVGALIAHGSNDPTVNISSGEASRDFWLKQNGCGTETKTWTAEPACVEYQGCQTDLPVVWCVHDEAHSWPSLTFGCNRDAGGGVCFDGGSAIWAFFSTFR